MRENSPRNGLTTCLRKKHSGSFNVLNYWICKPCRNSTRVKKSQDEMLEPIGAFWGEKSTPWTDCEMLLTPGCSWKLLGQSCIFVLLTTRKWLKLFMQFRNISYWKRQNPNGAAGWALATLKATLRNKREKSQWISSHSGVCRRVIFWISRILHVHYVIQRYNEHFTYCGSRLSSHFLC